MHQPVWKNHSLAAPLSLADNEVHIWKLFLDASPGPALELLSAGEQQHYRNLRHPRAAVRYLNTRALSRRILGAYLQQPPASLKIEIAEGGKPHLRDDPL
ncbi:4'-phosphopantetheinyl transferase family protein, partial [Thiolapillus sp.]